MRTVIAATSPSSATSAVVDASVAVRALAYLDPHAEPWLAAAAWPSLLYAEVVHVLLRLARNRKLDAARVEDALDTLLAVHADVRPVEQLVSGALPLALERGLSVYDACYVALAETLDLPLVTADRSLASATPHAILLT